MDNALQELYQEIILEHNRMPRNKRRLQTPTKLSHGNNPSCGDEVVVFVDIDGNVIREITFDGEGCAISQASASLMTELLVGKTRVEAAKIIGDVCSVLGNAAEESILEPYGEVSALAGVKKFPMRVKCATLAWHAANEAIA
ncbi:MAG: SUF system NifU family Fe-S cluster assembly protein [Puniceicoccales bacterium]|nr:SUF system NifU family Fe-S cluster assembly protein [Puniceicoccales bacterium]